MARRSTLVAVAAIAAALLLPATASADPTGLSVVATGGKTTPVTIGWTPPAANVTPQAYRVAGACPAVPAPTDQISTPAPPPLGGTTTITDTPPDGTWCYVVTTTGLTGGTVSGGVTVDRPSTGVVAVSGQHNPNYIRGTVDVTAANNADVGSGVASFVLLAGTGDCLTTGTQVGAGWTPANGVYNVCDVVTDNAGNVTVVSTIQVIADNTPPAGTINAPAAGAYVSGTVNLGTNAADAVLNVQWSWTDANGSHAISTPQTNPANGFRRSWNTLGSGTHAPDGPVTITAVATDKAGNPPTTMTLPVVVDNIAPAKAVVTAPPAVAGSPTMSWAPVADAGGIDHYDLLRDGAVVGTPVLAAQCAPVCSLSDKTAPNGSHSYVVRAYDHVNHMTASDPVTVLVDSTAVSAPKGVTAPTPTSAAPALSWQAPATFAVAHYDIYRDGRLLASTAGPVTTFTDATATEGAHDYAVLARNAASQPGVLSSSFSVLFDRSPPVSGGAPNAQIGPTGSVQLAWPAASDALSGVAGYVVRRAAGGVPPAAVDGGTAVCALAATTCADPATASGTWSYGVFARDGAGNVALVGTVSNVSILDKTAPLAPTKLTLVKVKSKKRGANITFTLRWVKPTAPDLERVVVVLNLKRPPTTPADGKAIYKGLGTSAKVHLHAGQNGFIAIFAFDQSGNVSPKPARTVVRLASLIPLRPLNGSVVRSSSPTLTWKALKGTEYYNVQVFVKGKRILTGWPSKAAYTLPAGKLAPGTYVWFVWPAVKGKGGSPTFGKLIGRATFTYKK